MTESPFLDLPGAVDGTGIDAGVPWHYGNPLAEQRRLGAGAIVDLSHHGVIEVRGVDRLSWLDSLTSQSIAHLLPGDSAESLLLDPNGRLENVLRIIEDGSSVWLLGERAQVTVLATWLDRMRFMLRVEVLDRSDDFATIGALTATASDLSVAAPNDVPLVWHDPWVEVARGGFQYSVVGEHPGAAWTWTEALVARADLDGIVERVRAGELAVAGLGAAEALRIAAWRPRLALDADERTIPHELDWLRSAVHLNKGCYRGQETVAKVHNLGHPPRRLVLLQVDGSDSVLPAPGSEVLIAKDGDLTEVGVVTSSAVHFEEGPIALAVIKRNADPEAVLEVRADGLLLAAAQEVIVPPDAGATAGVPRLPRLGAR